MFDVIAKVNQSSKTKLVLLLLSFSFLIIILIIYVLGIVNQKELEQHQIDLINSATTETKI